MKIEYAGENDSSSLGNAEHNGSPCVQERSVAAEVIKAFMSTER
jgi:hypothetical protein